MTRLPGWAEIRARGNLLAGIVLGSAALLVAILLALLAEPPRTGEAWHPPADTRAAVSPPASQAPDPAGAAALAAGLRFLPVPPDRARAMNAAIPASTLPNPPAPPFVIGAVDDSTRIRATDCLAAAIAATAPGDAAAGRAVAQLILNRVRHFAYPKSICGVVFARGADGACPFPVACDGSLVQPPAPLVWANARALATAALAGAVDRRVGLATYAHPDSLVPVPIASLIKVATIGHWIFYRGTGRWSAPDAFTPYAGIEPDEPAMAPLWSADLAATVPAEAAEEPIAPVAPPLGTPAAPAVTVEPVPPPRDVPSLARAGAATTPLAPAPAPLPEIPAPAASPPPSRPPALPASPFRRKIPQEPSTRRLPIAGAGPD